MTDTDTLLDQARTGLDLLTRDRGDAVGRGLLGEAWSKLAPEDRPDWLVGGRADLLVPRLTQLPLRTDRLLLRHPEPGDVTAVHAMYSDPAVVRHLPFGVLTPAECEARVTALLTPTQSDELFAARPMVEHEGRVIGELTLRISGPSFSVAEVGWGFHPSVQGRGFASEAARALVELAFALGVHRVFATLDPRNDRSAALCERLGMTRETTARQDYWSKGEWTDSATYASVRGPRRSS